MGSPYEHMTQYEVCAKCGEEYDISTPHICKMNDAGENRQSMEDSINPNHYTSFAIAPNEYITANELGWEVGNVIKYVSRYKLKNGLEDLRKAQKYLELLIEREYTK